jgi:hypothetical protein
MASQFSLAKQRVRETMGGRKTVDSRFNLGRESVEVRLRAALACLGVLELRVMERSRREAVTRGRLISRGARAAHE